jgi:hypothetical protein
MPRRIDHLVICVHDLARAEQNLRTLGFTLTPTGVHPFGTSFHLAMFGNNYLELLAVTDAAAIPAAAPGRFSFAAHHQNFLATAEGMSMLAWHSADATPMPRASRQTAAAPMRRSISAATRRSRQGERRASSSHSPSPPTPPCPESRSSPANSVIRRNCSGSRTTSTTPTAPCVWLRS